MQSLYAFFSSKDFQEKSFEKEMIRHINEVPKLHLFLLNFLTRLVNCSEIFLEELKKKHLPSESDLKPKRSFMQNKIIYQIFSDKILMNKIKKNAEEYLLENDDLFLKIFNDIYESNIYTEYANIDGKSFKEDKQFLITILDEYVLNNKTIQHIIDEKSIYWIDDLPFVFSILVSQIKSLKENQKITHFSTGFRDNEDKDFALQLFKMTIRDNKYLEEIIIDKAKNWELDRIAIMDQILLKMAFSEILHMQELPIKVSMNEYIEISKYYSTTKSKVFINGILDSAVKEFKDQGKIKKIGRGLI